MLNLEEGEILDESDDENDSHERLARDQLDLEKDETLNERENYTREDLEDGEIDDEDNSHEQLARDQLGLEEGELPDEI